MSKITEIKERLESVTYGEWEIYRNEDGVCIGTKEEHPQLKAPAPIVVMSVSAKEPNRQIWISNENAEFIKHSPKDVEVLLGEIERLQNGIKFIQGETQCDDTWDYLNHLLEGSEEKAQIHRFK